MRAFAFVQVSAALLLCVGAAGCDKEAAPGGETAPPPQPALEAPPTAAGETPTPTDAPADDAAPAMDTEAVVGLAMVVAEVDCTADRFSEPDAQDAAIAKILADHALTREAYDKKVLSLLDNSTFNAAREKAAALCRAAAADAPKAPHADPVPDEEPLRDKLKQLAIAAECMRKSGATGEEMAPAMLALYTAHGIALETYTQEMAKLATNAQFQAEVAKATEACPTVEDELPPEGGEGADNTVGDGADPAPPADPADAGATDEDDAVVAGADPDGSAAPPSPGDEDPAEPGTDAAPADPPPAEPVKHAATGVYRGAVAGGNLRVTLSSRGHVQSAVGRLGGVDFRLKGRLNGRRVNLAATKGRSWVRLAGALNATRGTISGTWNGVIRNKRSQGKFTLKR